MARKRNGNSTIGRNASSGRFITVKEAKAHPRTTVIETIKPGPKKGK